MKRFGEYLVREGFVVTHEYSVEVCLNSRRERAHRFDLGNKAMLVECKYYSWTEGGNIRARRSPRSTKQ